MALDPKDFMLSSHVVDSARFASIVSSAVDVARVNPFSAVTLAAEAGSALRSILSPSPDLLGTTVRPFGYEASAISSLASLRQPMEMLTSLSATNSYASTLNVLSSAGNIGLGIKDIFAQSAIATSHRPEITLAGAAFQVGVVDSLSMSSRIAAPYLASSAAVFSLETSYSTLFDAQRLSIAGSNVRHALLSSRIASLQAGVFEVSSALKSTWDSIRADTTFLSAASMPMLRAPAVELYTATQASAAFSLPEEHLPDPDTEIEEILDEAADEFESRLGTLHQDLVSVYRGGIEALKNGGTDWQRHVMVSFRELSTHALHLLAPDDKILPKAKAADLHDGRPTRTRRARLNFIFAEVAGPAIADFFDQDMKAALELFELLNTGTHRLEQNATPDQVHYLRSRVVGLLSSMLDARGF